MATSDRSRIALKLTLLLAPAILMSLALGLGAGEIRDFARTLFSRRAHHAPWDGNHFYLPDASWERKVVDFFADYKDRFVRDNPFRIGDVQNRKVARPLRPLTRKLTIVVVSNAEEFERQTYGQFHRTLPHNGGYFDPRLAKITIDAEGMTPDGIGRPLSHELTHAIMFYSYADKPDDAAPGWAPWLSEGVAQWCEIDQPDSKLGQKRPKWLDAARDGLKAGRLRELIKASQDDFTGGDNAWYYRASYALFTFLLEAEDLHDRLLAYFDKDSAPGVQEAEPLFEAEIGGIEGIEKRWREWLDAQRG